MVAFYVFAAVAVGTSLMVVAQRNPIYSVLLLIASFGALSGLYVLLEAPFAAVIQIIVYAGAIMVLFLFVVMLLNAPKEDTEEDLERMRLARGGGSGAGPLWFGAVLSACFVIELLWVLSRERAEPTAFTSPAVSEVSEIGAVLFTDYAFAFEVTSVLILVAMVGAVVLARREPAGSGRPAGRP